MGTVTRKRTRADANARQPSVKRPPPPTSDSDIHSSDADSHPPASPSASPPPSPPPPLSETAEEKRLRLARAYLRHAGISSDAGDSSASSDDDNDDNHDGDHHGDHHNNGHNDPHVKRDRAGSNAMLREHALHAARRVTRPVADALAPRLCAAVPVVCRGHARAPTCVALADARGVAVSGGKDSRLIVWDVATGARRFTFKPTVDARTKRHPARAAGHIGNIHAVALSDDGVMAASGGEDGLIRVWDVRAGHLVETLKGHRAAVQGLAFRAASRQLFSASRDRTVKVWDVNEMAYVETLFGHGAEVNCVDSLGKERALSCGRDGTLRLYKVVEGSQLVFRRAATLSIDVVAMVNEQRFVSGGDDGAICLWQMNKKKPTAVVEKAHGDGMGCAAWISSVAAFRNTDLIASGAGDGMVRFWKCEDVPKLVRMGELDVGPGFVNGIAVGKANNILALAVGNEHRLGRWEKIGGVRNTIQFVSFAEPKE